MSCFLSFLTITGSGATTISNKAAAKQYLAITAPLNAAASKFVTQVDGWTTAIKNAKAKAEAKPAIAAVLDFNTALAHDAWPRSARSDVAGLRKADAPLVADLRALSSENLQHSSSILAKFARDESALEAGANVVRYDLGLSSTPASTSTNPAISSVMMGTADPKIPPMVPGKVAILVTAPPYSAQSGTTVAVMVGNGTSGPISHLVVSGPAVDSTGKVVATGGDTGFTPTDVAPGQVSFGYLIFGSPVPAGAKFQLSVTYNLGVSPAAFDLQVTKAKSTPDQIVGSVTNSGTTPLGPEDVQAFCFDSKGALRGVSEGGVEGLNGTTSQGQPYIKSLMPGVVKDFNIGLNEPPCPTFLAGAWAVTAS